MSKGTLSPTPSKSVVTVNWGQGPISFELQSDDADFIGPAAKVFASWPVADSTRIARRWRVHAVEDNGDNGLERQWEAFVSDPQTGGERSFFRGARAPMMQAIEFDAVRELLECPEEILGLHGGLLARDGLNGEHGVALIGPCFAGKSTLSCALWQSGWSFLGDDVTLFHGDGTAYPAPRRASLRESSRELVGDELWMRAQSTPSCDRTPHGLLFHPHETDGRTRPQATRLAAIICLARRGVAAAPAELQKVNPAQAALALLPYSNLLQFLTFPEALARMAAIAEVVPVYDLGRGPLPEMIARLDTLVA